MLYETGPGLPSSYRTPRRRAQWAILFLVIIAIVTGIAVASDLEERDILQRMQRIINGERVTLEEANEILEEAEASDDRQVLIGRIEMGLLIASGIPFLLWMHLAYLNLKSFGIGNLRFSPRWVWFAFFIPIINLFRPYQIAADIWRGSNTYSSDESRSQWHYGEVGDIVKIWWGSWLVLNGFGRALSLVYDKSDTVDQMLDANLNTIILDSGYVIGALITAWFVWNLTQRQDHTFAELRAASAVQSAPPPLGESG